MSGRGLDPNLTNTAETFEHQTVQFAQLHPAVATLQMKLGRGFAQTLKLKMYARIPFLDNGASLNTGKHGLIGD